MPKLLKFLRHLFIPHESNNHRAKVLHHKSLFILILFFIVGGLILTPIKHNYQNVLGISADISVNDLLNLTNLQREKNGLQPLVLNPELTNAAQAKAQNMFQEDYWAHFAPDGTSPWTFIKNAGYDYVYAGENLARGYTTAPDVVNAWMASPGHKANILSPNYKDIGFAVMAGNLTGEDTVLVVQEFGSENSQDEVASVGSAPAVTNIPPANISPTKAYTVSQKTLQTSPEVAAAASKPLINSNSFSKEIAVLVIIILLVALILDILIMQRRKIFRLVAHNVDHVIFLVMILLIILFIIGRGIIL
ncbi:MAG TPA: CAP domain-containing protein [Patescibacteria group bacterium]|nr:CAP domain-containing protein [Patescibacteria group bacterium]